jgi:hypothetical protein
VLYEGMVEDDEVGEALGDHAQICLPDTVQDNLSRRVILARSRGPAGPGRATCPGQAGAREQLGAG